MTSIAVLSTLKHVTRMKLEKLAKQQRAFEEEKGVILDSVKKESDQRKQLQILLDGFANRTTQAPIKNIQRFLDQARHDTSISPSMLNNWIDTLQHELDCQHYKYTFTSLFGRLVNEWIEDADARSSKPHAVDNDSEASEASFEPVGREESHQQRKEWESYVFNDHVTSSTAIKKFLDGIFLSAHKSKKFKKTPIEQLQEKIANFEKESPLRFDTDIVLACIKGLLKCDLFTGEKRKALVDLKDKTAVLSEMADVLNADLDALDNWAWAPSPVPVSMRKSINGKYRVYMDEELYHAIFLQYIGSMWAVHLKKAFTGFFHSGAWVESSFRVPTKKDLARMDSLLETRGSHKTQSIRNHRRSTYMQDYFMTQLPSSFREGSRDYDDDGKSDEDNNNKSPLEIKHSILCNVTAESLINTHMYGSFVVLQTDFKWFGPSLPHSTIAAVVDYFHFPQKWAKFFRKFLAVPMVFVEDGSNATPTTRKSGVPISHILADALGEAVLFTLDFAVNQRTKGANLYRFHDDLWFWGQPSTCVEAWKIIKEFTNVMGLSLNEEKTGTVMVCQPGNMQERMPKDLPRGEVKWGFLKLDASIGSWKINEPQIAEHTQELKRQLSGCRSVFAYVQAYNAYMTFFLNNLGMPAYCLGQAHVDMVVETIQMIQLEVFGKQISGKQSPEGNIATHLKQTITDRFGVNNIPDAFIFLPTELGGLDVRNPLIALLSRRSNAPLTPRDAIIIAVEEEEEQYEKAKEKYEARNVIRASRIRSSLLQDEPFLTFEEYTRFREERSVPFLRAYEKLIQQTPIENITITDAIPAAQRAAAANISLLTRGKVRTTRSTTAENNAYQWNLELYGNDVISKFGGLSMGERELLPIGLLEMLKSEKVRWQG